MRKLTRMRRRTLDRRSGAYAAVLLTAAILSLPVFVTAAARYPNQLPPDVARGQEVEVRTHSRANQASTGVSPAKWMPLTDPAAFHDATPPGVPGTYVSSVAW